MPSWVSDIVQNGKAFGDFTCHFHWSVVAREVVATQARRQLIQSVVHLALMGAFCRWSSCSEAIREERAAKSWLGPCKAWAYFADSRRKSFEAFQCAMPGALAKKVRLRRVECSRLGAPCAIPR